MPKFTLTRKAALGTGCAAALAGLTAAILVGCTAANDGDPATKPVASSTPTVAVTPEPAAPVEAGAPVTQGQALPEGATAFTLADGTSVAVLKDQPLPAPVQEAVQSQVNATAVSGMGASSDAAKYTALKEGAAADVKDIASATGKGIVLVFPIWGTLKSDAPGTANGPIWGTVLSNGDKLQSTRSAEESLAGAQAFVQSQQNPSDWVIVQAARP